MRRGASMLLPLLTGLLGSAQVSSEIRLDATANFGPGWRLQRHPAVAALDTGASLVAFVENSGSERVSGLWLARLQGGVVTQVLQPSPSVHTQRDPAISCGSTKCLLAWVEEQPSREAHVMAALIDGDGPGTGTVLAGPSLIVATPGLETPPALATVTGTEWLLAWSEQDVFAQRIDRLAQPVGGVITVSALPEAERWASVARLGSGFVVAWSGPTEVRARTVSSAGVVGPQQTLGPAGDLVSMASGGSIACATWARASPNTVFAARVGQTGVIDVPPLQVDALADGLETRPFVAFNGQFLLQRIENNERLSVRTLSLTGPALGPQRLLLAMGSLNRGTASYWNTEGVLAFDGASTLRAWTTSAFPALSGPVAPRLPPSSQRTPSGAFLDGGFLVAFEHGVGDALRTSVSRLGIDGRPVGPPRLVEPGTTESPRPVVASDGESAFVLFGRFAGAPGLQAGRLLEDGTPGSVSSQAAGTTFSGQTLVAEGGGVFTALWHEAGAIRAGKLGASSVSARAVFAEPRSPFRRLAADFAAGAGVYLVAWDEGSSGSMRLGLLARDLAPLTSAGVLPFTAGSPQVSPSVSSNGHDFLLAWVEDGAQTEVRAALLTSSGALRSGPVTVSTAAAVTGSPGAPSAVWDGTSWVLGYERVSGASGTDLFFVRVFEDGGVSPERPLSAGPESEEAPSLSASTPGRVLALYSRLEADAGSAQVFARLITEVPDGAPCLADTECVGGSCREGRCSPEGSRRLRVGCGCAGSDGAALLAAAVLTLVRRRTRRTDRS